MFDFINTPSTTPKVALDFLGKPVSNVTGELLKAGFLIFKQQGQWFLFDSSKQTAAQALIEAYKIPVPDLDPVQFHFLLNRFGFDMIIEPLLNAVKDEDITRYAMYKAYLGNARKYEFNLTLSMFEDIRDKMTAIDPDVDFTEDQLKDMWLSVLQM